MFLLFYGSVNGSDSWSFFVLNLLVITGVVLSLGALLVLWIKQPVERIAVIKFTWASVVLTLVVASLPVFPRLDLAVLRSESAIPIATASQIPVQSASTESRSHGLPLNLHPVHSIAEVENESLEKRLNQVADGPMLNASEAGSRVRDQFSYSPLSVLTAAFYIFVGGGCLVQIAYFGLSWVWTRRIIDQTEPLAIEQLVLIEAIMNRIISGKSAPQYATSETIQVPLVYGLFNPVIVLPRRMLEANDEVALGHGLAHEWAHLVNRDLWMLAVANVLQCFLWMHPAFWILRREQRLAQDQLADQMAVHHSGRMIDYAEMLLQLARERSPSCFATLSMTGRASNLRKRIQMVLDDQRPPATLCRRMVAASGMLTLVLPGLLLASVRLVAADVTVKGSTGVNLIQGRQEPEAKPQVPEKETTQEPATQPDQKPEQKTEIRRRKIRVVNPDGKPVPEVKFYSAIFNRNAIIEMEGLSKSAATNENGEGEVLYPFSKANPESAIHVVTLSMSHPDYMSLLPEVPVGDKRDTASFEIVISPGISVTLKAIDGDGEPFKGTLNAVISGDNAPTNWKRDEPGQMSCRTMAPGARQIMLTHEDSQGKRFFSDIVFHHFDDEKEKDVVLDDIELLPGIPIRGKFSDKIPRPVKNGVVIAMQVPMPAGAPHDNVLPSAVFNDWCEVNEDGTFVFESMPRTGKIQLIPICDGWTGLAGETGQFIEGQLFDVKEQPLDVELNLLPTYDVKIRLVDGKGKPLPGLFCGITPTQLWFLSGSTLLGTRHRTMGNSDPAKSDQNSTSPMFPGAMSGFHGESDEYGEITIRNIPRRGARKVERISIQGSEDAEINLPEEGQNYIEQTIVVRPLLEDNEE